MRVCPNSTPHQAVTVDDINTKIARNLLAAFGFIRAVLARRLRR